MDTSEVIPSFYLACHLRKGTPEVTVAFIPSPSIGDCGRLQSGILCGDERIAFVVQAHASWARRCPVASSQTPRCSSRAAQPSTAGASGSTSFFSAGKIGRGGGDRNSISPSQVLSCQRRSTAALPSIGVKWCQIGGTLHLPDD